MNALERALCAALLGELESCLAVVADDALPVALRVHDARTHLKRWRALMLLERDSTRRALRREENVLKLVARRLGAIRDPEAQLETWKQLSKTEKLPDFVEPMLDRARSAALGEKRVTVRLARAKRALALIAPRVRHQLWREEAESKAVLALLTGAAQSYRKARRALADALAAPSPETLHALRRANKSEQYQLQFFELLWKKPLRAQRKQAAQLSEYLGTHHDLSGVSLTLQREAEQQPFVCIGALRKLDERRAELERQAFHLGRLLYAERPSAFERRLARYIEVCLEDDSLPHAVAAE